MDNNVSSRRRFLLSAGAASTIVIAGCSGDNSTDSETPDDSTDEETPDDDTSDESMSDDSTDDNTSDDEESVFADYGIDGTDLSVEIAEEDLNQVARIRLETPSGQKETAVSETISEYSIDILRDRAGVWLIDALDSNEEIISTAELEPSFGVSADNIGTLAQLGITGESPASEEVEFQLTVTNTEDVPVEPFMIQLVVPDLDIRSTLDTIGSTSRSSISHIDDSYTALGGLVDRDEERVITAGNNNKYRYTAHSSGGPLVFFDEDEANENAGEMFDGEIIIGYKAEREETVIPITIEMGNEVITDSNDISSPYLRGTAINKR